MLKQMLDYGLYQQTIKAALAHYQSTPLYPWPRFSPNHNARPALPVSLIVLHYTGMQSGAAALEWLCNPESEVSAHYLVEENGEIFQLVEEDRRAWHAGVSYWAGARNINDISIGIELVNGGHEWGYSPFPPEQIAAVIALCQDIMLRHELHPASVIAHSDVAPARKSDPGELFPWEICASYGIGVWHNIALQNSPLKADLNLQDLRNLKLLGYEITEDATHTKVVITAFQRHFRAYNISGHWDLECAAILDSIIHNIF